MILHNESEKRVVLYNPEGRQLAVRTTAHIPDDPPQSPVPAPASAHKNTCPLCKSPVCVVCVWVGVGGADGCIWVCVCGVRGRGA